MKYFLFTFPFIILKLENYQHQTAIEKRTQTVCWKKLFRRQRKLKYQKSYKHFLKFAKSRPQKREKNSLLLITSSRNINSDSSWHHFQGNPVLFQKQLLGDVHKKMCLKFFLQNSWENISTRVFFFIKMQAEDDIQLYLKDNPELVFSCVYCKIFSNTFFAEDIRVTTSAHHRIFLLRTLNYRITNV